MQDEATEDEVGQPNEAYAAEIGSSWTRGWNSPDRCFSALDHADMIKDR